MQLSTSIQNRPSVLELEKGAADVFSGRVELRPIPGVLGYAAGSDGHIYSFRGPGSKRYQLTPKKMRSGPSGRYQYPRVTICWKGQRTYRVHTLVCLAFNGECPPGEECSHLNGDRLDNRPKNLEWETHRNNILRRNPYKRRI